jgi:Uma2 family endonuclease
LSYNTFAPWAEPMPEAGMPLTAGDLARLPDDGRGYELVEGKLVRMSPTGGRHSYALVELVIALGAFVKSHRLGFVGTGEQGFMLSKPDEPDTVLAPDVAFVRAERIPHEASVEYDSFWRLAPDLVVEVAFPTQYRPELAAKARLWLAAGTRLVWVIWPNNRQVDVWRPGSEPEVITLHSTDMLDGEQVLPGFRYPVAALFRPVSRQER